MANSMARQGFGRNSPPAHRGRDVFADIELIEGVTRIVRVHALDGASIRRAFDARDVISVTARRQRVAVAVAGPSPAQDNRGRPDGADPTPPANAAPPQRMQDRGDQLDAIARLSGTVLSPAVGIARALAPCATSGEPVEAGERILDVESLQEATPVRAHRPGRVVGVFVRDGQPVEFGSPLVLIE